MGRRTAKVFTSGFFLVFLLQSFVLAGVVEDRNERAWTVMVYLGADNSIAGSPHLCLNWYDPVVEGLEAVGSSQDLAILVLWDLNDYGDSKLYYVDEYGDYIEQEDDGAVIPTSGEVSMGDPRTLIDFGLWSMSNYPSRYTALIMTDHGGSWRKSMLDDTNGGDSLTTPELGEAISVLQPDILAFDACTMASTEVVYEIRDYVDYYCGSEEVAMMTVLFNVTAPFDYEEPLTALKNDPSTSPKKLSMLFVESYDPYSATDHANQTFSAVDTSKMDDLEEAINQLADLLLADLDSFEYAISQARSDVREYEPAPESGMDVYIYVDLYDLVDLIAYYAYNASVDDACQAVKTAIDNAVVASTCVEGDNSYGLTIFLPDTDYGWIFDDLLWRYRQTQFGIHSSWDEILDELF